MAIEVLHCVSCEDRYDIHRDSVDGRVVRCPRCGRQLTQDLSDWGMVSRPRDRYRKKVMAGCKLLRRVGAGRDSLTYRAEHQDQDMPVWFEVFPHDREGYDEEWIVRLFRGLAATTALRHPHVVALYDLGRREGYDYIIREIADGGSVRRRLEKGGRMALNETLPLAEDLLRALKVAERRDLHCGRISPDNLLLDYDGSAKLDHFGRPYHPDDLAEFVLTPEEELTGPCYYVAPEQARDHEAGDIRTDLYSLGATLYEMLCGRRPFDGESAEQILTSRLEEEPTPPGAVNTDLPPEVCEFIEDLMERDPEDRPESATAALARLRDTAQVLSTRPKVKEAPTILRDGQERSQRLKATMWTVLAFVLAALALVPLYKLASEDREADRQALQAVSPIPHSGRVLVVMETGGEGMEPARRRALLTMAAVQVGGLGRLTAVDPFLAEEMLRGEESLDRALLKTDPAYVLRLRRGAGEGPAWHLSFTGVRGQQWRVDEDVESDSQASMSDGLAALLGKAARKMEVEAYRPITRLASEEVWRGVGRAMSAERAARFDRAREILANLETSQDDLPALARVLDAYYARVEAWTGGQEPAGAVDLAADRVRGEFSSLARAVGVLGDPEEPRVRAALARLLADRPTSPRGHYLLGLWRSRSGHPAEEALAAHMHAVEVDPGYLPAARAAARLQARRGGEGLSEFLSRYRKLAWDAEQIKTMEKYCESLRGEEQSGQ